MFNKEAEKLYQITSKKISENNQRTLDIKKIKKQM